MSLGMYMLALACHDDVVSKTEATAALQTILTSSAVHHGWCRPSAGGAAKHGYYATWRGDTRFLGSSVESALTAARALAEAGIYQ